MDKVDAVVVDDGEPNLERCIASLRNQTVDCNIILAPGPKTDLKLAASLADVVMPPAAGIGRARVNAILKADSNFILSCDSDSYYSPNYGELALQNLKEVNAVKAGTILPLEGTDPLALVETSLSILPPYEFSYSFRRSAFLAADLHKKDYSSPRSDIGWYLAWRLLPRLDPRMQVWTRFPTKGAKTATNFVPAAFAAFATVITAAAVPVANELSKLMK